MLLHGSRWATQGVTRGARCQGGAPPWSKREVVGAPTLEAEGEVGVNTHARLQAVGTGRHAGGALGWAFRQPLGSQWAPNDPDGGTRDCGCNPSAG
jgi:hypothetical protein